VRVLLPGASPRLFKLAVVVGYLGLDRTEVPFFSEESIPTLTALRRAAEGVYAPLWADWLVADQAHPPLQAFDYPFVPALWGAQANPAPGGAEGLVAIPAMDERTHLPRERNAFSVASIER
jgi:hypothetical protein